MPWFGRGVIHATFFLDANSYLTKNFLIGAKFMLILVEYGGVKLCVRVAACFSIDLHALVCKCVYLCVRAVFEVYYYVEKFRFCVFKSKIK